MTNCVLGGYLVFIQPGWYFFTPPPCVLLIAGVFVPFQPLCATVWSDDSVRAEYPPIDAGNEHGDWSEHGRWPRSGPYLPDR